jgi:hypothetical protein
VLIEINCPECGTSGEWKLYNGGFGFGEPHREKKTEPSDSEKVTKSHLN